MNLMGSSRVSRTDYISILRKERNLLLKTKTPYTLAQMEVYTYVLNLLESTATLEEIINDLNDFCVICSELDISDDKVKGVANASSIALYHLTRRYK